MREKGFFCLKIGLTLGSLLVAIIAKSNIDWNNLKNNYIDPILAKEMFYDLAIGIFSAMVLVWFIDEINERISKRKSQEKEKAEIKRFDKVLQCYIDQYTTFFYCVATPLESRDFRAVAMPKKFTLKDMRDLHRTSLLVNQKITRGSVESFLQIELDLRREIISIIERYDFNYYPKFISIFLNFVQASLEYDCRSAILAPAALNLGDKSWEDSVRELLDNKADEYYNRIKQGEELGGTIVHPYMFLYDMMNAERNLIEEYQEEIKKLG